MFCDAETRLKLEEAQERREWRERWLLPLIPEAPAGLLPLNGVLPPPRELRRMERELMNDIRESRRRRGQWSA